MSEEEVFYTVGQVAHSLNVTVRTLHHWESQGLLTAVERNSSNYRLYSLADVKRLQQILIYRATGMNLAQIKQLLSSSRTNIEHLHRQRENLLEQQSRISKMLDAIDKLLDREMRNQKLDLDQVAEILGNARFAEYQKEAEELFGDTEDWRISQERTSKWDASDWSAYKERIAEIDASLAEAARNGVPTDSAEAASLVAAHREALGEFYPVSVAKHYLLSRAYITDQRFRDYYEQQQAGLAQWLADAIAAVASAHGVDFDNVRWE